MPPRPPRALLVVASGGADSRVELANAAIDDACRANVEASASAAPLSVALLSPAASSPRWTAAADFVPSDVAPSSSSPGDGIEMVSHARALVASMGTDDSLEIVWLLSAHTDRLSLDAASDSATAEETTAGPPAVDSLARNASGSDIAF